MSNDHQKTMLELGDEVGTFDTNAAQWSVCGLLQGESASQGEHDDEERAPLADTDYIRCSCPGNNIRLNLPVSVTPSGKMIACLRCYAEMKDCVPATPEEARRSRNARRRARSSCSRLTDVGRKHQLSNLPRRGAS